MAITDHHLPSEAEFARLESELFGRIERRYRRQVIRHRLAAASVAVVIAGAGVAAGTVANPTQETRSAKCYSAASTASQATTTFLSNKKELTGADESLRPSSQKIARAVGQCSALWAAGAIGGSSAARSPKLQPCLQDNLVIAVFPRRDDHGSATSFCENLGMSAP